MKSSSLNRIVVRSGKEVDVKKRRLQEHYKALFESQNIPELQQMEREKSLEEKRIIQLANDVSNSILQKYGADRFDIPEKNVHLLKPGHWLPGSHLQHLDGAWIQAWQAIAVRQYPKRLCLGDLMVHEMTHGKLSNVEQMDTKEDPQFGLLMNQTGIHPVAMGVKERDVILPLSTGLQMYSRDGNTIYLNALNEALSTELTKRHTIRMFKDPVFSKEMRETAKWKKKYPTQLAHGIPLSSSEIYCVYNLDPKFVPHDVMQGGRKMRLLEPLKIRSFGHRPEREIFTILVNKIHRRNLRQFPNSEAVFDIFAYAAVHGNTSGVRRLIDRTFGNGTFLKLLKVDRMNAAQLQMENTDTDPEKDRLKNIREFVDSL